MMREYTNELKKYNFLENIKEGSYLDVKDQGKWKVGQVKQIRKIGHKQTIQIYFDGFPPKYNQSYDIHDYNHLAPFRKYTLPYTGRNQSSIRDEPSKNLEYYIKIMNKLSNQIEQIKSQRINQFIRGELFIYIDYIFTRTNITSLKNTCEQYVKVSLAYLDLFQKILQKVFEFLKEVQKQGNLDQNYIYVHPKMALLYSITQFLFNCNSMISKNQERIHFHKLFSKNITEDHIFHIFNQRIKQMKIYEKCQYLMNFKCINQKNLSWSIKKQALILMKTINSDKQFLNPKQHKQIIQILEYIPYFVKKNVINHQEGDRRFLDLIFNLLIKGNFEGKLIGLNEIKKRISMKLNYSISSTSFYNNKTFSTIIQQIQQKNVISFLLDNNNFNSQLFKRSLLIFQFCYKNGLFEKSQFSNVFKLHKDKHQLQLVNFYNSLAEFGLFLNEQDTLYFFQKLTKQLPFEQNFIELVKTFTFAVIDKNQSFKKRYMRNNNQGFGLIYFWQIINKEQKIDDILVQKVIQCFAALLNKIYYAKSIQYFVVQSIKSIKQLKKSQSFLKVIHQSLRICTGTRMIQAIEIAQKDVNIIEAAMNVLKLQQNNLSKSGFQNLFQFLQEVNYIKRGKGLTVNDVLFIWKLQKQKCRKFLLKFLRNYKINQKDDKSYQKIINKTLDASVIDSLIKNIFEDEQLMQSYRFIDQQHFQTCDELIISSLHKKGLIDYTYKHTIRYKNQYFIEENKKFQGLKFYIKCIQNCQKQQINIKATKRLIQFFLRPDKQAFLKYYDEIKVKNWLKVSNIINSLKNNKLRSFKILLQQINGRMKSLNILDPDLVDIVVKIDATNKVKTITVPRYTSLWKLRQQINLNFSLNNRNFHIILKQNNQQTYFEKQQDFSVSFINFPRQKGVESVIIKLSDDIHPHLKSISKFKQLFSQNFAQKLYQSLSSADQSIAIQSLQILSKIPKLQQLHKKIQKLQIKSWPEVIDNENMYKLQYQLQIIQNVKNWNWINNFINKDGPKHLFQVILNNLKINKYPTLKICLQFLIQTLQFMKDKMPINQGYLKSILIYEKQQTQGYYNYMYNCFKLISSIGNKIKIMTIFQKQQISKILQFVLFTEKNNSIHQYLINICKNHKLFNQLNIIIKKFINLKYLQKKMYQCRPFFRILSYCVQQNFLQHISGPIQSLLLDIRKSQIEQKSQKQTNYLLCGYIQCLYGFSKNNKIVEILLQSQQSFFDYLINKCLFNPQNIALRKFKSKQLRQLGFKLLILLQKIYGHEISKINNNLIPLMSKGAWRKQHDWNIQPIQMTNKKYTGLKNLAATCYINSLLQQLFYIKSFSHQLMTIDSDLIQDQQNIVKQIQNIFGFLKFSDNQSYTTISLCKNFILDGQPIDPRIQTDVDEFFHALMDKLENNLQKINKKQIINQIFRGQFSNLIIGQQCPHTSQRVQHFLSIRLQIKNKKTLEQAFEQFIKGEMLQGQNLYFCQKCNKKVKALKRVCLKDMPQVLIVTLKRFEFDFDTMQKFKLNSYCSFPQNINLLPYTKQGIENDIISNEDKNPNIQQQKYQYKLKGVIIHYGISQAGHYTSYVRTHDQNWNYFDDQKITQFDLKNLQKQCFGGIQQNPFGDDQQKKKNAYLLIYQKINLNSFKQKMKIQLQINEQRLHKSKVYSLVEKDNLKNRSVNILFESNMEAYIKNLAEKNPKIFFIYFHNVYLRNSKKYDQLFDFYEICKKILDSKQISQWYLSEITQLFLCQFVLYAQKQVRYIVSSLICHSMTKVFEYNFILQCVSLLNKKNIIPLVKILSLAFKINSYMKQLLNIQLPEVILNIIKDKQIKQNNILNKIQIKKQISIFGQPASQFYEYKKTGSKDLFIAIQDVKINLNLQQIKKFIKQIKNLRTMKSLAVLTAKKYKDVNSLNKFIQQYLTKQLLEYDFISVGQQFYYNFYLYLIEQIIKIPGAQQQKRCLILTKLYFQLMKQALVGFKCQLMLVTMFFKMWLTIPFLRQIVFSLVSTNKQYKKLFYNLKEWIKLTPNLVPNIQNDTWNWWMTSRKNYKGLDIHHVKIQIIPPIKQSLSLINSIMQKQNIQVQSQDLNYGDLAYYIQNNQPQHVKIIKRLGFLFEVLDNQSNKKYICQDDLIKKFI